MYFDSDQIAYHKGYILDTVKIYKALCHTFLSLVIGWLLSAITWQGFMVVNFTTINGYHNINKIKSLFSRSQYL